MARKWQSGLELNSTGADVDITGTVGGGLSIVSTQAHGGTYSAQLASMTSATAKGFYYTYLSAEGTAHLFFRTYLRVATRPSAENRIMIWNDSTATASPGIYITLGSDGTLKLYDEDGAIGSASSALSNNTWYRIELEYDTTLSAGSQVVTARVDGTNFATSSTRSIASNNQPFHWHFGGNMAGEAQTQGEWYYDDLAINDATGSYQNSWPGEGYIIHLQPNADGDNTAWTNTYTYIDEVTPNGATDYIESNTTNQLEDENLTATPAHLNDGSTINVVAVGVYFAGASTSANASFRCRIKDSSSGTVTSGTTITPATNSYRSNTTARPADYSLVSYTRPGGTNAWTKTYLDSAQVGVELTASSTNAARVSTLWVSVDYVPSSGSDTALTVADLTCSVTEDAGGTLQADVTLLGVGDLTHAVTIDGIDLSVAASLLGLGDLTTSVTIDGDLVLSLGADVTLTVQDATCTVTMDDTGALTVATTIAGLGDLTCTVTADTIALSVAANLLGLGDLTSTTTIENVTLSLTVDILLAIADLVHATSSEAPGLTVQSVLQSLGDLGLVITIDDYDLTSQANLTVSDMRTVTYIDGPSTAPIAAGDIGMAGFLSMFWPGRRGKNKKYRNRSR